jgi:hypothetical protein
MTGFIVSVFQFRNRVSFKEAFEGLELGEGKLSRPVLRGPGGRKAAWLLGTYVPLPRKQKVTVSRSSLMREEDWTMVLCKDQIETGNSR